MISYCKITQPVLSYTPVMVTVLQVLMSRIENATHETMNLYTLHNYFSFFIIIIPLFNPQHFNPFTGPSAAASSAATSASNKEMQEEHSKRLTVLEHQYESSRFQTHIARGVGLGYGSAALTTELPSQKDTMDKLDEKL